MLKSLAKSAGLVLLSSILSVGLVAGLWTWHQRFTNDFDLTRAVVYKIEAINGSCSGVMIAPKRMLSAAHCDALDTPVVEGKKAKRIAIDHSNDVMLLEVDIDCPCASMATALPKVGSKVIIVGFPYGVHEIVYEGKYMGIVVSDIILNMAPQFWKFIVTTAPAEPGNSGGGLFVFEGDKWVLLGIVSAAATHHSLSSNHGNLLEFIKKYVG